MPAPASTAEKQAGQWLRPDMPLVVSILGVRPNSPTTTTSVLFSRPRACRSSSRADSASSSRGSAQPSPYDPLPKKSPRPPPPPYDPLPKISPCPIPPPCMSQVKLAAPPWEPSPGAKPHQPLTLTKPTPDSTNPRAVSRDGT